jgi:predicted nucleotide-binding protein
MAASNHAPAPALKSGHGRSFGASVCDNILHHARPYGPTFYPFKPERPFHTVDQKRVDIDRLSRRMKELEEFDPHSVSKRFGDPNVTAIETAIDETLAAVFGHGTVEYNRYSGATRLDHGPVTLTPDWIGARGGGPRDDKPEARRYIAEGKQQALSLLRQAVRGLTEEIELAEPDDPPESIGDARPTSSRSDKVFIVHGHEEAPREAVARFLERIGLDPIILHEQANQGKTVIEKFEAHADVGFAIVLLTPDDIGGPAGGQQQPRARQNVILELGYFIGRLSRARVCALKAGDLELPSDILGIVWTPFDPGWKQALANELQAAGYDIDWNKVMRS